MGDTRVFDVRFHLGGRQFPTNPHGLQGQGTIALEPDFVTVRGRAHRTFHLPNWEQHRLRLVDVVNVRTEGPDLRFDVLGVKHNQTIGCTLADGEMARRVAALLPARQTEAFAIAHADFEAFHDRIDYWSPSTPVIWTLLVLNVGIYLLMWLELQGLIRGPFRALPGWGAALQAKAHAVLWLQGLAQLAHQQHWWPLLQSFIGLSNRINPYLLQDQLIQWGANKPSLTLHGQPWRLASSMFLHGSLVHIVFNMVTLWQVGQLVERIFGSLRFLALYMIAGLCGSMASVAWNVLSGHDASSVGASGAIFGILGGLLAFIRRENSGVPATIVKELRASAVPFLLFNLTAGFLYAHTDNAAHLGGLLGGFVAGHLVARSLYLPKAGPVSTR